MFLTCESITDSAILLVDRMPQVLTLFAFFREILFEKSQLFINVNIVWASLTSGSLEIVWWVVEFT